MTNTCLCLLLLILACIVAAKRNLHCGPNEKREQGKCLPCPKCPGGEGLQQDCGFGLGAGLQCVPCETGITYRSDLSYKKCKLCTNCTFYNREFLFLCRRVIDSECGKCLPGYFEVHTEPSNPPTVCIPCSKSPLQPQCLKFTTTTTTVKDSTATEVMAIESLHLINEENQENSDTYKYATWILLCALIIALLVILGLVYILKRYAAFHYCDRRNICHRGDGGQNMKIKSHENNENIERINLISRHENKSIGGGSKQPTTSKIKSAHGSSKTIINEKRPIPQIQPVALVQEKSVQNAPKVGRSLSDPGPTSPTIICDHPVNCSGEDRNNNIDDFIIQMIPPAVVHMPCVTDVPNMAIPFGNNSDNNEELNESSVNRFSNEVEEGISGSFDHGSPLINANSEMVVNDDILPSDHEFNDNVGSFDHANIFNIPSNINVPYGNEREASFHLSEASTVTVRDEQRNQLFPEAERMDTFNTEAGETHQNSVSEIMSANDESAMNEDDIHDASTVLIGELEEPCNSESIFSPFRSNEINDFSAIQHARNNSHDLYNIPLIPTVHDGNPLDNLDSHIEASVENNNININDLGGVNPEPTIAGSVISQTPPTIQITINNNIGATTGVTKTAKEDKAINAVNGDESDKCDDSSDNPELDSSQTIPKCIDFTNTNSGSSCALAHANSMSLSYHYPVQETVNSN